MRDVETFSAPSLARMQLADGHQSAGLELPSVSLLQASDDSSHSGPLESLDSEPYGGWGCPARERDTRMKVSVEL